MYENVTKRSCSLEEPLEEDPYAELHPGNDTAVGSFGGRGGSGEPYSVYSPQVYPHLMPQNILQVPIYDFCLPTPFAQKWPVCAQL